MTLSQRVWSSGSFVCAKHARAYVTLCPQCMFEATDRQMMALVPPGCLEAIRKGTL